MALLYTFEGWANAPSANNTIRKYDLDTAVWTTSGFTAAPFAGTVNSAGSQRQQGGWDPVDSKWYVISPTGSLYAYYPTGNTWAGPLANGAVLVYGNTEDNHWCMASDGRFVYIMMYETSSAGTELHRYNPSSNTVELLTPPPIFSSANTFTPAKLFLVWDGDDHLYAYRGADNGQVAKYSISTGLWSALPLQATMAADTMGTQVFSVYLSGGLYVIYAEGNTDAKTFFYNPLTNAWVQRATALLTFNASNRSPYHIDSDRSIRIWNANSGNPSFLYDIVANTWTDITPNIPYQPSQGGNWAQTRVFNSQYVWYESDSTTLLNHNTSVGSGTVDFTFSYHVTVKTISARPSGITISVVDMPYDDGDGVATISNTQLGSYSTSFSSSSPLAANDLVDVWIKVMPAITQSLGITKNFNLQVVSNS